MTTTTIFSQIEWSFFNHWHSFRMTLYAQTETWYISYKWLQYFDTRSIFCRVFQQKKKFQFFFFCRQLLQNYFRLSVKKSHSTHQELIKQYSKYSELYDPKIIFLFLIEIFASFFFMTLDIININAIKYNLINFLWACERCFILKKKNLFYFIFFFLNWNLSFFGTHFKDSRNEYFPVTKRFNW